MAWVFGGLLLGLFASMPLLRPLVGRALVGAGTMRGAVLLAALLTVYAALFLFLVVELMLALDGQQVWPLHVNRPWRVLAFFGGIFAFALLLLAPLMYLGDAARRAGTRFASARGLAFEPRGGPWSISPTLEPWTLQWKVDLGRDAFIAAATTTHVNRDSQSAMTYRTVGVVPGDCAARGTAASGEKILRKPGAGEREISVGDVRFLVPAADVEPWRRLLEASLARAPQLTREILYIACEEGRAAVALATTLRAETQLSAFEDLLWSMVGRSDARRGR